MASRGWRLTWLTTLAKLRAVGWAPWMALLLWGTIAALGEPSLLRGFATWLPYEAAGAVAATIVIALLRCAPSPRDSAARVGSHLMLLAGTATVLAALLAALDAAMSHRWDLASLRAAGLFAVVMLPGTVAMAAASAPHGRSQTIINKVFMIILGATSVAVAVQVVAFGWTSVAIGAAASCTFGCVVLVACSDARVMMRTDHEDRNTR